MQLCIQECYMPTLSCATFWQTVYCHWSAGNCFCGPTPSYQVFSCGQLQSSCIRNQGISASCPAPPPTLPQVNNVSTASEGLASMLQPTVEIISALYFYLEKETQQQLSTMQPRSCNLPILLYQVASPRLHAGQGFFGGTIIGTLTQKHCCSGHMSH